MKLANHTARDMEIIKTINRVGYSFVESHILGFCGQYAMMK